MIIAIDNNAKLALFLGLTAQPPEDERTPERGGFTEENGIGWQRGHLHAALWRSWRGGTSWRMNSGDGFQLMDFLKNEPGGTLRVEMMEGGWSSGDGSTEWSFTFNGTPEDATYLRSFLEGQWRRGGEKELDIKYHLQYDPPLIWDDGGEGWISRHTRLGIGAQTATITLELTAMG